MNRHNNDKAPAPGTSPEEMSTWWAAHLARRRAARLARMPPAQRMTRGDKSATKAQALRASAAAQLQRADWLRERARAKIHRAEALEARARELRGENAA